MAFLLGEFAEQLTTSFPERIDGALFGAFQEPLELGKRLLNRVEVWAVGWQVDERGTRRLNRFLDADSLVAGQVIHDHDVAWVERRQQMLLDVRQK